MLEDERVGLGVAPSLRKPPPIESQSRIDGVQELRVEDKTPYTAPVSET